MESSTAKLREWMGSITDFLNQQEWFQEIKSKWEELDVQSRNYFKFAAVGSVILLLLIIVFSSIWSVHSLKSELREKRALLTLIQNANDEMRKMKDSTPQNRLQQGSSEGEWSGYLETVATTSGIDRSNLTVSPEKPGASTDQTKEYLIQVELKHVNIKQIVRYAFGVENGQRPVKVRNLQIDTKEDPSGYMDATLALSAFNLVEPK